MTTDRRGTISFLGAGASADAGYPSANALLTDFANALKEDASFAAPDRFTLFEQHLQRYQEIAAQVGRLVIPEALGRLEPPAKTDYFTQAGRL